MLYIERNDKWTDLTNKINDVIKDERVVGRKGRHSKRQTFIVYCKIGDDFISTQVYLNENAKILCIQKITYQPKSASDF